MLQVHDLTCGYDTKFFLKNINFKIKEKEFVGIIGPNGSGKTTLLRALTKIIRPRQGSIYLEGDNIENLTFKELAKKIAVVSQGLDMELRMEAEEYVLLGRIPYRRGWQFIEAHFDRDIAEGAMASTDTLKFRDRLMENLSGGERQLVVIARALAQQPKLMLLDEPTSHLDITHQVAVLDLLKRLNSNNGLTVAVVLHDLNLASEYCDRLILLQDGRIYKIGIPQEVLTYQTIEEVYKTVVVVKQNPVSLKPYVFLVSQEGQKQRK
ncbi:MAG: ABC transporter ATP-binding protein [Candidatus Omnitrophica bacterium]|nr:ABC transporter ATP-binding protein [Candidatus Omnitrophota bacterium]